MTVSASANAPTACAALWNGSPCASYSLGQWCTWTGPGADAEIEPPARYDVHGRRNLGQHGGWAEPIAGHQQPDAKPLRLRG